MGRSSLQPALTPPARKGGWAGLYLHAQLQENSDMDFAWPTVGIVSLQALSDDVRREKL